GKLQAARALAARLHRPVLNADLRLAGRGGDPYADVMRRLCREAVLQNGVLFVRGYDALVESGERQVLRALSEALRAHAVVAIIAGTGPWVEAGDVAVSVIQVDFNRDSPEVLR